MAKTSRPADHTRSTVVGVVEDHRQAKCAVQALHRAGFTADQVGIARRGGETTSSDADIDGHAGEGAATGAVTGGVLGGLLGAAAALLIPGIGPVVAGGILAATLGGAAIGATAGGLLGALIGMGLPEDEAHYYEGEFQSGRTLVAVRADERYHEASSILRQYDAYDVDTQRSTSPTAERQAARDERTFSQAETAFDSRRERASSLKLREKELRAQNDRSQSGEVEIRKEVVE